MAVRLGCVNVDAMLRSLTAKQFMEWEAYARMEPFNEARADYRAASIVTMLANINRDTKKRPIPFTIQDFVLRFEEAPVKPAAKKQTWAEQEQILRLLAAGFAAEKGRKT